MYLAAYTWADVAYAIHQAARFAHRPKHSHALAIKRKLHYLKTPRIWAWFSSQWRFHVIMLFWLCLGWVVCIWKKSWSSSVRTGYLISWVCVHSMGLTTSNTNCSFDYGGRIHCPISSYERLNFYSRNCERNIPQGFQETIDSYMHCPIKDFSETQEETYPSFIVYEDNSACLQFAKMPKMSPCTKHIGLPDYWFRGKYLL